MHLGQAQNKNEAEANEAKFSQICKKYNLVGKYTTPCMRARVCKFLIDVSD